MEKAIERVTPGARRHFSVLRLSLLRAFPRFTEAEQDGLFQLYVQVITSLHESMQVGTTLDTVEHLVEQQILDPLFLKKTNLLQLKHEMLATMDNEVHLLEGLLDKFEDQKHKIKAQIKLLKKKREESEDTSGPTETVEKISSILYPGVT